MLNIDIRNKKAKLAVNFLEHQEDHVQGRSLKRRGPFQRRAPRRNASKGKKRRAISS